jgi:glycerol-3-phosphate dehydrogenase
MPEGATIAVLAQAWGYGPGDLVRAQRPSHAAMGAVPPYRDNARVGCNERHLAAGGFPAGLRLTADIAEALVEARNLLIVVLSEAFRSIEMLAHPPRSTARLGTKGMSPIAAGCCTR